MAFPPIRKRGRSGSPSRNAAQTTAPLHGATQTGGVAASEAGTRLLSRRGSAASHCERAPVARPARTEARVPAGQPKTPHPQGARSAGKSATLENPAHSPTLPIVTRMGRDYRPGSRQRIERVAVRQRQSLLSIQLEDTFVTHSELREIRTASHNRESATQTLESDKGE